MSTSADNEKTGEVVDDVVYEESNNTGINDVFEDTGDVAPPQIPT